jgi:hypothetical protein
MDEPLKLSSQATGVLVEVLVEVAAVEMVLIA